MNDDAYIVIIDEEYNAEEIPVIGKDKIEQIRKDLSKYYSEDLY